MAGIVGIVHCDCSWDAPPDADDERLSRMEGRRARLGLVRAGRQRSEHGCNALAVRLGRTSAAKYLQQSAQHGCWPRDMSLAARVINYNCRFKAGGCHWTGRLRL